MQVTAEDGTESQLPGHTSLIVQQFMGKNQNMRLSSFDVTPLLGLNSLVSSKIIIVLITFNERMVHIVHDSVWYLLKFFSSMCKFQHCYSATFTFENLFLSYSIVYSVPLYMSVCNIYTINVKSLI